MSIAFLTSRDRSSKANITLTDPVLLCNNLGIETTTAQETVGSAVHSSGRTTMSVKEAVRIAQGNNFMGLICNARLLVRSTHVLNTALFVRHCIC